MRKHLFWLLLFTLACNLLTPRRASAPTPAPIPPPFPSSTALPSATPLPTQTAVPTPAPSATLEGTSEFHLRPSDITFHPDPQLYSGDIVSFEISAANADPAWQDAPVSIYAGSLEGEPLTMGKFGQFGIGGRAQATFFWAWNTRNLVGPQTLFVTVDPEEKEGTEVVPGQQGQVLSLTVNLLPAEQRPMPEPLARWAQTESACCVFHYLTGTAAARDIEIIKAQADEAFAHIESVLDVQPEKKVGFTLLSRLLGHGGFASDEISVTYIDRNPAGNNVPNVFAHEGTHILDRQIAQTRPALLTEGLAVYVAGGHFKPEDLEKRVAALLALDGYIPLEKLANDFYPAQHETGYLEGGALVTFLVDRYGWDRFKTFYGSFEEADSDAKMLEEALRANFDISLSDLEAEWLAHLRSLPADPAQVDDLRLTISLYDTLRRYQSLNDPAAYFLTAWLPNAGEARRRGIVADFVRHPTAPENLALETMLVDAGRALGAGEFATTEKLLNSVNAVLDAHNLFHDPLAADYLEIVIDLADTGYEAQTITLNGNMATVTAIRDWPAKDTLTFAHIADDWVATSTSFSR